MMPYPPDVEQAMKSFCRSLREQDRRRDGNAHVVDQLLDRTGYHRRQAQRARPLGAHPDRDAQFETIARLKRESLEGPDPILSIDTKARELIGNYYRKGTLLTRRT